MTLQDLIDLKVGETFIYKHQRAIIVQREHVIDLLGYDTDGDAYYWKSFNVYFTLENGKGVNLYSCHPNPKVVDFSKRYDPNKKEFVQLSAEEIEFEK